MSFTTIQNTPITINLNQQANARGWSIVGDSAVHETCNIGVIKQSGYPIVAGLQYEFSYTIDYINSGLITAKLGNVNGVPRSTTGFFVETITAVNTDTLEFYSNANVKISPITIRVITNVYNEKPTNTLAWSEKYNKWASFRGYSPDFGFSMFINMFMSLNGRNWVSTVQSVRNNFFGVQNKSIIKFVANQDQIQPKTFQAISYKSNKLMITTSDGIETSIGQLSNLIDGDFLKDILNDGVSTVNIYSVEGVFSAGFMKAKPDVVNGDVLKGNYVTVELIEVSTGVLKLTNITVHSEASPIGSR